MSKAGMQRTHCGRLLLLLGRLLLALLHLLPHVGLLRLQLAQCSRLRCLCRSCLWGRCLRR